MTAFINRALRTALKMKTVTLEGCDVENIKTKRLNEIEVLMSERQVMQYDVLAAKVEHMGANKKTARDYIALLVDEGILFQSGRYVLHKDFKPNGPLPGTEGWYRLKTDEYMKEFNAKFAAKKDAPTKDELDAHEASILAAEAPRPPDSNGSVPVEHKHSGPETNCIVCDKPVCESCAGQWIRESDSITGKCKTCA
jgi:hypothetical protein